MSAPDALEVLISRLRELMADATPGPLYLQSGALGVNPWVGANGGTCANGDYVRGTCILNMAAHDRNKADAELIVEAINALPRLLAALSATDNRAPVEDGWREENLKLRGALQTAVDAIHLYLLPSAMDGGIGECTAVLNARHAHSEATAALAAAPAPPTASRETGR